MKGMDSNCFGIKLVSFLISVAYKILSSVTYCLSFHFFKFLQLDWNIMSAIQHIFMCYLSSHEIFKYFTN